MLHGRRAGGSAFGAGSGTGAGGRHSRAEIRAKSSAPFGRGWSNCKPPARSKRFWSPVRRAGDGKSFTAVNLALAEAQLADNPTLLCDFDLRSPTLHGVFRIDRSPGISDYLLGKADTPDGHAANRKQQSVRQCRRAKP